MANTVLTVFGNRLHSEAYLSATVSSVAADASIAETFFLPPGMGDLWVEIIRGTVFGFSGAYVAPAPAFDGLNFGVLSADGSTSQDLFGAERFVHAGTTSARPELYASIEMYRRVLLRQNERLLITAPILAGAGVTVSVSCAIRGVRLKSA